MIVLLIGMVFYTKLTEEPASRNPFDAQTVDNAAWIQTQVEAVEQDYQLALQHLMKENSSLQQQISGTKEALAASQQQVIVLKYRVSGLSGRVRLEADTIIKLQRCDSLSEQVDVLVQQSTYRDQLCDSTISGLERVVSNKDSTIQLCQQSYTEMRSLTDSSLIAQRRLQDGLALLTKQVRRKKREVKFLTLGMAVMTGVAATMIILK